MHSAEDGNILVQFQRATQVLGKLVRYNEKALGFAIGMGLENTVGIVIGPYAGDFLKILWFTENPRILYFEDMMFLVRHSDGESMLEVLA